jgi:hypothetical protein
VNTSGLGCSLYGFGFLRVQPNGDDATCLALEDPFTDILQLVFELCQVMGIPEAG